ncbi:MAG TPA: efflux RND transporter periplasmic adaptor subunit [Dokdonella sp.]|uniref:efflux RND transporter periplasmic adaptor subunit n=1 Tax=Dokdonella sp. TaxID=2291710 RepID=UPI002D7E9CCB|nr:efflux RND transporter periplasmic adaptor subunit [Dokdonella sp.]HET9031765.1 efflux RND transporter periplasmic adaptor subunit [Dokdonella sp.]
MSRGKVIAGIVVVVVVGLLGWRMFGSDGESEPRRGGRGGGDNSPIPVTAVAATAQDVPVFLTALGTVQALNTVTVSAQVTGQLQVVHFAEGQHVKKGDLIAEIDPRSYQAALDQAVAKKKQDEAQLAASRSTLKRYEDLIEKNFVSAQDLENQRQIVRQQEAVIAGDAAAVNNARTQLSFTRIIAPIDGLAGIRLVDAGNLVQANGSAIVVLTQTQPINVIFNLPQQDMAKVREADATPLKVIAMSRADSTPIAEGELKVIDNSIDTSTATFKLKSEFANADRRLWPGEFVNVRLAVRTVKNGIVVPATGVQQGPDGEYAWVVQADSTVKMQSVVTAGTVDGGGVLVAQGLDAGDKVITEGQFRLKAGIKVAPMAPGEVTAAKAPVKDDKKPVNGGRR